MPTEFLKDITLLIKTFERRSCLLRLVGSIRKYYPDVRILIVDDSKNPETLKDEYIDYHILPFNQGISYGRNYGLEKIKTKYFLLLDDDYVFTPGTDLEKFLTLFQKHNLDILAGRWIQNGITRHFEYQLLRQDDILHYIPKPKVKLEDHVYLYDIVHNFWVAETSKVISAGGWDDRLKLEEHTDFFLKLQSMNWRVGYCPDLTIRHQPKRYSNYMIYRNDPRYSKVFNEKHGIRQRIFDHDRSPSVLKKYATLLFDYLSRQLP
jgi:glycosyltransferase involved in cell wall biosynthesis